MLIEGMLIGFGVWIGLMFIAVNFLAPWMYEGRPLKYDYVRLFVAACTFTLLGGLVQYVFF